MKVVRLCAAAAALVSGLVLVSCNSDTPTGPSITGNTYNNPALKFQITVPDGWTMTQDTSYSEQTYFLHGSDTAGMPRFNIVSRNHMSDFRVDTLLLGTSAAIEGAVSDFEVVTLPDTLLIDGKLAAEMMYTFTSEGVPMQSKMLYMVHNGRDLVMTIFDVQQYYAYHEAVINQLISSIELQ